jgi:glycine dehydrogenase
MMTDLPLSVLAQTDNFVRRHNGYDLSATQTMLNEVNATSLDDLTQQTVPESIRMANDLNLPAPRTEYEALGYLRTLANQNKVFSSYIGQGYHDTIIPPVILRNVMENPGWYTAYTPYQPEIAQGRLEALLNFQQLVIDMTGMELANASLLDEATAAAEAMSMAKRTVKRNKSNLFFIDEQTLPQTIDVVKTRAEAFGWDVVVAPTSELTNHEIFGALLQYPGTNGQVDNLETLIKTIHDKGALAAVASDLMSLCLLKSPGEQGADIVLGNAQRFGVPMGFGGPHAAFFATREKYKRSIPGRIIGVSIDANGKPALRMALQTREQHIRREKANSNICTAQVLLANLSSFYAVYHGPQGLKTIASRIHRLTDILALGLKGKIEIQNSQWFDTLSLKIENRDDVLARAEAAEVNLRIDTDTLGVSISEKTRASYIKTLLNVFLGDNDLDVEALDREVINSSDASIPSELVRTSEYLSHPVFNSYHTEHEMLRYMKRLENKDLAMNHSMITLGSCTMKLNATTQMLPVTWNEFSNIHPFAPRSQTQGY